MPHATLNWYFPILQLGLQKFSHVSGKLLGWDDTIVALATPPGIGAIAVIRLSGSKALQIIDELFPSKKISEQSSHTTHVGLLVDEGEKLDEVVISLYKLPRSYTGEDVVEISGHGSPYVQNQIIQACIRHGARLARPGEFTQRAFLNGKLDLAQAEAVADLIASNSEASRLTALNAMKGGFSQQLKDLRERMLKFSALIELELDFSQEDVEFADRRKFYELIDEAEKTTNELLLSFKLGNVIRNGVQVAIIGKPNAGKSTLLNALLNENRAIVSDIAGTTRDTIEELLNIDGIIFRLIDTAGIREHSTDLIENLGIEKSREKIEQADLVVALLDGSVLESQDELVDGSWWLSEKPQKLSKFIYAVNKSDLLSDKEKIRKKINEFIKSAHQPPSNNYQPIFLSAKNKTGLDELKKALVEHVLEGKTKTEGNIVTNARHFEALERVAQSLKDIRKGMDEKLPGDLLSLDIRRCLHYLGDITGEVTNDDQLSYIFSKFCIGK